MLAVDLGFVDVVFAVFGLFLTGAFLWLFADDEPVRFERSVLAAT